VEVQSVTGSWRQPCRGAAEAKAGGVESSADLLVLLLALPIVGAIVWLRQSRLQRHDKEAKNIYPLW
jgi:hypothetical protein